MPKSDLRDFMETFDQYHLLIGDILEALPRDGDNTSVERLIELQKTLKDKWHGLNDENWEEVAVYFASCTAATTEGLARVKGQKSETRRHMNICESLVQSLKTGMLINKRPSDRLDTIDRLEKALTACKEKLG